MDCICSLKKLQCMRMTQTYQWCRCNSLTHWCFLLDRGVLTLAEIHISYRFTCWNSYLLPLGNTLLHHTSCCMWSQWRIICITLCIDLRQNKPGLCVRASSVLYPLWEYVIQQPCNVAPLNPCNHSDTDPMILLNLAHDMDMGIHSLRPVDSEVMVVTVRFLWSLGLSELWLNLCAGIQYRDIPIYYLLQSRSVKVLGISPLFHNLRGCDKTLYIFWRL